MITNGHGSSSAISSLGQFMVAYNSLPVGCSVALFNFLRVVNKSGNDMQMVYIIEFVRCQNQQSLLDIYKNKCIVWVGRGGG